MSVRAADPDTSVEAWVSMYPHLSKERAVVLAAVERGGLIGFTAEQVVTVLAGWGIDRQRNCVASRLSELAKLGEIADTRLRRDGSTRRPQIVWRRVRTAEPRSPHGDFVEQTDGEPVQVSIPPRCCP